MGIEVGTRTRQNFLYNNSASQKLDRGFSRDVGMSKNVTDSFTFTASNARITGAGGDFANFAVDDVLLVEGTQNNNGEFAIVSIAGDTSYVVVDKGVVNEGPISITIRTK